MSGWLNALKIRVDIEGLRETLISRVAVREKELGDRVEAGLTKAINELDVEAIVQREAGPALRKAVEGAVKTAAASLAWDSKFKEVVYRRVQEILAQEAKFDLEDGGD